MSSPAYSTPEAAALASYSPASEAFVIRVEQLDSERSDVIIDTRPSHPMRCHCYLTEDGWIFGGDIVE